jgi:non-specific serine/threonine protein kinase
VYQRNSLPHQISSFVGREDTVCSITRLLADTRLLTLTGPGGIGKTRLALRVAADALPAYPDGGWLIQLESLSDPDLVPSLVAEKLNIYEEPGRTIQERLIDSLRTRRLLLVLDNCEHLLPASALLADWLLRNCGQLTILATSRRPLGISGEQTWLVPPLRIPDLREPVAWETLVASESVQLFVRRAQESCSDFRVIRRDGPTLVAIADRLDGIPLALELAAARAHVLGIDDLLRRIDANPRFLRSTNTTTPPRQETLNATLDWSYDLLSESERRLFEYLSVFSGGWTLEAAEVVAAGCGCMPAETVFDLLHALVTQSLVVVERKPNGDIRYRFLETIRRYSRHALDGRGTTDVVKTQHAAYFLHLAKRAAPLMWQPEQHIPWLEQLSEEQDNVRLALDWYVEQHQVDNSLILATALSRFWLLRSVTEGRERLRQLLAVDAPVQIGTRARAFRVAARLAWAHGDYAERRQLAEQSVTLFRQTDDLVGLGLGLQDLGSALINHGDYTAARAVYEESISVLSLTRDDAQEGSDALHALGFRTYLARSQLGLANIARDLADFSTARQLYADALPAYAPTERSAILEHMAWLAFYEGDLEHARTLVNQSLALEQVSNRRRETAVSRTLLGRITFADGAPSDEVIALYADSFPVHQEFGNRWGITLVLEGVAALVARRQPSMALRLAAAAHALRARMCRPVPPAEQSILAGWLAPARRKLSAQAQAEAWESGAQLDTDALNMVVTAAISGRVTAASARPRNRPRELSPREWEIAGVIAEGRSNREIARELVISESTVQRHVANILAKLGMHSRAELAVWTVAHKLTAAATPCAQSNT